MDQELITRFRAGDDAAKMAIRTHLRAVAARVLVAPQWKLSETTTRSALEIQAAVTALESSAQDPVGFAVAAMHSAAVAGLEHLRALDGALGAHPEADVMAQVALETAAPGHVVHVERHAKSCPTCTAHLDVLRAALTSAATAQRATAAPPAPTPSPKAPAARKPPTKKAPPKRKRPGAKRKKPEPSGLPWGTFALIAGAVAAVGWWTTRLTDQEQGWIAAAHLPDELPSGAMASEYEGGTADAIQAMAKGDCRGASTKLHMAWKRSPDDWNLRYLEGLSYVCLRDGKALEALQDVNDNVHWDELPWAFEWWYAQALVLDGQIGEALAELDTVARSDHPRAPDARALADRLRSDY